MKGKRASSTAMERNPSKQHRQKLSRAVKSRASLVGALEQDKHHGPNQRHDDRHDDDDADYNNESGDDPDSWFTPDKILHAVKQAFREYGVGPPYSIQLDPCTTKRNHAKARRFYVKSDNALAFEWCDGAEEGTAFRTAFVNPPFASAQAWIDKTETEISRGNVECAIMLLPIVSEPWWFRLVESHPWAVPRAGPDIKFGRPVEGEPDELRAEQCPRTICLMPLCGPTKRKVFHRCFVNSMKDLGPVYEPVVPSQPERSAQDSSDSEQ